ncbi:MAG: hypothetical protein HKN41_01235 [Ilumatobacter sp.]|nr:hypothetical protein [Ilumatobacter sp.]
MMPTYSPWLGVAVLVIVVLVVVGGVAITAAIGQIVSRALGREVGCLVGGFAALAWIWLLVQIENAGLGVYSLVLIGVPLVLTFVSRAGREWRADRS